jgi:hypothetical protein
MVVLSLAETSFGNKVGTWLGMAIYLIMALQYATYCAY